MPYKRLQFVNMDSHEERNDRFAGADRADKENGHTERPRGSSQEGRPSGDREELFDVFGLFRNYFDTQLSSLKKELTIHKTFDKIEVPVFKSSSCKHQFVFNAEICSLLDCILDSDSLGLAKEKAKESLKKLKHRNKLVRLADSSPGAGPLLLNMKNQ